MIFCVPSNVKLTHMVIIIMTVTSISMLGMGTIKSNEAPITPMQAERSIINHKREGGSVQIISNYYLL